ncbi:MAG: NADH-quinone oxidoreductase subunit L, partial [Ferruginibacter sp.]
VPLSSLVTVDGIPLESHLDIGFSAVPVILSIAAILFAAKLYRKQNDLPDRIAASFGGIYRSAYKKFYIDEIYLFITKKIIFNLVGKPAAWIDKNIVDGFMNLLAAITEKISVLIKGWQSGKVQNYALYFFAGIAGLAVVFIYWWK